MKASLFTIILILFVSCSTSSKKESNDPTFNGEFLYLADAAVLNTGSEIYGVVIDEKMHELHEFCSPFKRDEYDMIQVYVKGVVTDNPEEEGWEKIIRITAIDSIANPVDRSIIKPN